MNKDYCDRCGKEMEHIFFWNIIYRLNQNDIDLCKNCRKDFRKWLKK